MARPAHESDRERASVALGHWYHDSKPCVQANHHFHSCKEGDSLVDVIGLRGRCFRFAGNNPYSNLTYRWRPHRSYREIRCHESDIMARKMQFIPAEPKNMVQIDEDGAEKTSATRVGEVEEVYHVQLSWKTWVVVFISCFAIMAQVFVSVRLQLMRS